MSKVNQFVSVFVRIWCCESEVGVMNGTEALVAMIRESARSR